MGLETAPALDAGAQGWGNLFMRYSTATAVALCLGLAACQSSGTQPVAATPQTADLAVASTDPNAVPPADPAATQAAAASAPGQPANAKAAPMLASAPVAPGQCHMVVAGGPPEKPAKGADFGKAVTKDVGKNVSRNVITMLGGAFGGQIGSVVASSVATSEIRTEADLAGTWLITDLTPDCACEISVRTGINLQGKSSDKGPISAVGCNSPALQKIANWTLGYSFTGYNAKFELKTKDNRTVLATLNRDGIHYFSGTLADGTPVVMWRDGQNYSSFKKATN